MIINKKENLSKKRSKIGWLILFILVLAGLTFVIIKDPMGGAKKGDTVNVTYSAYFENGSLFQEKDKNNPLIFVVGVNSPNVLPVLNNAVLGMKKGGKKVVLVNPKDAYGKYYDIKKIQNVPYIMIKQFGLDPKVGEIIVLGSLKGKVKSISGEGAKKMLVLDVNEPETWQTLRYEIKLLDILK